MIQFNLSAALTKELSHLVTESEAMSHAPALIWYAHVVIIARRKCIIAMELQSRYAMVFCGLTQKDFAVFPSMFKDRFWREVCSICQAPHPLPEPETERLAALVKMMADKQCFQKGNNPSVSTHIKQVKEELEFLVKYQRQTLPTGDEAEFKFGLKTNEILRKRKGDKDYFYPIAVFRDFWLGLLNHTSDNSPMRKDNVVFVDFKK